MGGKTSNASIAKYMEKAYDRLNILVPKGQRNTIKLYAAQHGESVNGFINRLIYTEMCTDIDFQNDLLEEMEKEAAEAEVSNEDDA